MINKNRDTLPNVNEFYNTIPQNYKNFKYNSKSLSHSFTIKINNVDVELEKYSFYGNYTGEERLEFTQPGGGKYDIEKGDRMAISGEGRINKGEDSYYNNIVYYYFAKTTNRELYEYDVETESIIRQIPSSSTENLYLYGISDSNIFIEIPVNIYYDYIVKDKDPITNNGNTNKPEVPSTPNNPEVPSTPNNPEVPSTPNKPETPNNSKNNTNSLLHVVRRNRMHKILTSQLQNNYNNKTQNIYYNF